MLLLRGKIIGILLACRQKQRFKKCGGIDIDCMLTCPDARLEERAPRLSAGAALPVQTWWAKEKATGKGDKKPAAKYKSFSQLAMVMAGKWRGSAAACSCFLLHHATALLLQRSGGAVGSPGIRHGFSGRGMSRSWCGVQQWRRRTSTSLPGHVGGGGGIQRHTTIMILDFFDPRARSQVRYLCIHTTYMSDLSLLLKQ